MKFANLCDHASTSINLGDYLQFSMISRLYEIMGVNESEVYYLSGSDIKTYQGEKLLLPLNFIATIFTHENKLEISEDIVPVFLALSLSNMKEKIDIESFFARPETREFFLKNSPIGCRDEYTYQIFIEQGIPAYLNGCLTATIPRRESTSQQNKVFFVDTPTKLLPYIPNHLFRVSEFMSQQAYFSEDELQDYTKVFNFVKERYEKYKREAKFVVTSRLHVAVPCSAMGIPVVFTKDYIDTRFSWLEKIIPLYNLENYSNIDWNPKVLNYEDEKKRIISLAITRIQSTYELYNNAALLDNFYLSRKALDYYHDSHDITHKNTKYLEEYASVNWSRDKKIKFGLWGITSNTGFWIKWIKEQYPLAEFVMAIDSYKEGEVFGLQICKPEVITGAADYCMIVIAVSAVPYALNYFKKIGFIETQYCIAVDSFITYNPQNREDSCNSEITPIE